MVQRLRALTILPEDPSLIARTHMIAPENIIPGNLTLFSCLLRDQASKYDKETHMQPKYQYR